MNQFQPIFNNKEDYFNKKLIILPPECNITVQCYYNESILEQTEDIKGAILEIFKDFLKKIPDAKKTKKKYQKKQKSLKFIFLVIEEIFKT